jgi:hypothetical protein
VAEHRAGKKCAEGVPQEALILITPDDMATTPASPDATFKRRASIGLAIHVLQGQYTEVRVEWLGP